MTMTDDGAERPLAGFGMLETAQVVARSPRRRGRRALR